MACVLGQPCSGRDERRVRELAGDAGSTHARLGPPEGEAPHGSHRAADLVVARRRVVDVEDRRRTQSTMRRDAEELDLAALDNLENLAADRAGLPIRRRGVRAEPRPDDEAARRSKGEGTGARVWALRAEGKSTRQIASDLNERGIRPPRTRWLGPAIGKILRQTAVEFGGDIAARQPPRPRSQIIQRKARAMVVAPLIWDMLAQRNVEGGRRRGDEPSRRSDRATATVASGLCPKGSGADVRGNPTRSGDGACAEAGFEGVPQASAGEAFRADHRTAPAGGLDV